MVQDQHNISQPKRTVSWYDTMIGADAARTMSGLDYLRAIEAAEVLFHAEQESTGSGR
jgi:hypothetical protein